MKSSVSSVLALASAAAAFDFTGIAVHSGDFRVHQKSINANGGAFWIGKNTTTFCPDTIAKDNGCPKNPTGGEPFTVFTAPAADQSPLFMDVEVPGGQESYIDPADGHWAFSIAHSAPPADAIYGFQYSNVTTDNKDQQGELTLPGNGAIACPSDKPDEYQIFSNGFYKGKADKKDCIGLGISTLQYDGGFAAWQYI